MAVAGAVDVGPGDGAVAVGDGEAGLGVVAVGVGLVLPFDGPVVVQEVMPNNRAVVSTNPRFFMRFLLS